MKTEPRSRHGLLALKARVKVRGLRAIDMRTVAAQDLIAFRSELLNALGGKDNVSPQKAVLVEMITRTRLYIDHIDAFIMSQPSLINKRRRGVLPIVRERQSLVDSLERLLTRVGLNREPAKIPSLQEYLESKEREEATSPQDDPESVASDDTSTPEATEETK